MTLPEYRYKPLRSRASTRLVHIQPGTHSQAVTCTLEEAFPAGPDEYVALSYTWGDARKSKAIVCNGRRLWVTENLMAALRRFRRADTAVTMWIDQICIDQGNVRERSAQVRMMGRIFREASLVVVWLGDDADDSRSGLQLARQILSLIRKYPEIRFNKSMLEYHGLPGVGHKRWQALSAIFRRSWFTRIWVIQEVVLSSRIEVACGQVILSWEEMTSLVDYLDSAADSQKRFRETGIFTGIPLNRINRIKAKSEESAQPPNLFDLLLVCRECGATDPRDKIYALLELGDHELTPDYSIPPREVFIEFATHTINAIQKISNCCGGEWLEGCEDKYCAAGKARQERLRRAYTMLSCAGVPNQHHELPSWVPDWSYDLTHKPLCFLSHVEAYAGGSTPGELHVEDKERLRISSKLCDTITAAGVVELNFAKCADVKAERQLIVDWFCECKRLACSSHRPVPDTGEPCEQALHRLFALNHISEEEDYFVLQRRSTSSFIEELGSPHGSLPADHHNNVMGVAVGRVLVLTSSGSIGLAPFGACEGDVVCVVVGGAVPFLLRPVGEDYVLLGECYVLGVMHGEAMRDENIPVHDMVIR